LQSGYPAKEVPLAICRPAASKLVKESGRASGGRGATTQKVKGYG
jgi:hypothetical protein